jgi:hypothetical protein
VSYDANIVGCFCEASRHVSDAQMEIVALLERDGMPDSIGDQIFVSLSHALAAIGQGLAIELRKL